MQLLLRRYKNKVDKIVATTTWNSDGLVNAVNFFGTQRDWNMTLITRINQVSATIHQQSLCGGATHVIAGAPGIKIISDFEYFHYNVNAEYDPEGFLAGSLAGRYKVYLNKTHRYVRHLLLEKDDENYNDVLDFLLVYNEDAKMGGIVKII